MAGLAARTISIEVFDAVFMRFTLELFERAMPDVLAAVRRVLCVGGRFGIVAMSDTGETNATIELYSRMLLALPERKLTGATAYDGRRKLEREGSRNVLKGILDLIVLVGSRRGGASAARPWSASNRD